MKKIDLHMHTTASDGELTPKKLVASALQKKMKAIAITDHDEVKGIDEALEYARGKGIEVISGIEISCLEKEFVSEIDIIGLFIDHKSNAIQKLSERFKQDRVEEKKEMVIKLNALGYAITFEEVLQKVNGSIGRPHIAKILIEKYPDKFITINHVFDTLIGKGKPAFVQRKKLLIQEAVDIIKQADGISVLAHPGRYAKNEMQKIIERFAESKGIAIEADYPYDKIMKTSNAANLELNLQLRKIAKEKNLLVSGGSDFHDKERGSEIGDAGLEEKEFALLRTALNSLK
ncbi:PHP domain-containing protein [Candidatus Woesearchaeota archaeon]|nr:PHP domain-containing protein [Candidatus Woesearchaeota archaeon]